MKTFEPKGTITAIVTPFNSDLTVDYDCFKKLIDFQIEGGVDSIVVCGSTGEAATLSAKEKMSLIITAVEHSNGRVPIIAGTGSNSTSASIDMTIIAKEHGADAVLLVAPYYNKPSQEGLYNHFLAISEHVDIPQIIYNVPGRSGVNITPETQIKIAENCKNVVATKEASGDLEQMMEIIKYAPQGFDLLCGDDSLTIPCVLMGGKGIISVVSNYAPKLFSKLVNLSLEGKYEEAVKINYQLLDLMQLNFVETNPVPVKAAMAIMGLLNEYYRLPLLPIQNENRVKIHDALKKVGLV